MNFLFNIFFYISIIPIFSYSIVQVSNCGVYSDIGEYYNLSQDISSTSSCISITSVNITFNCNNFLISGDLGSNDVGFRLLSDNSTILNCNIQNFGTGINAQSSNFHTFINSSSYNNSNKGFNLGGDNNTLLNIESYSNLNDGIYIFGDNNILNNII